MSTLIRKQLFSIGSLMTAVVAFFMLLARGDGVWATFVMAIAMHLSFEADIIRLTRKRSTRGYHYVTLHNSTKRTARIHVLVLESFIGPRPEGMQACHNNGKRDDNRVSNLRWDTPANNERDKIAHDTRLFGPRHQNAVLTEELVLELRRRVAAGEYGKDVAAELGIERSTAAYAIRGKTWSHLPGKVPIDPDQLRKVSSYAARTKWERYRASRSIGS